MKSRDEIARLPESAQRHADYVNQKQKLERKLKRSMNTKDQDFLICKLRELEQRHHGK